MTLYNPAALWLLAAALFAVIALSRLRRPRVRRIVGNAYLWLEAPAVASARPRRRTRVDALLVLQIACAAALGLSAARPLLSRAAAEAVIVVDLSASMGARGPGGTRLDRAKRRALEIVRRLPRGSVVRLIAARPAPAVLGPFTTTDPALAPAVDRLRPTAGGMDVIAAIEMARAASPDARISFITDGAAQDADLPADVERIVVGEPAENVAITRLEARALPASPLDAELLIEVRNFGARPRDVPLIVRRDRREVLRQTVRIGGRATYASVHPISGAGLLTAEIDIADALDADNRRFAAVRAADRIHVRLVTAGSFFLERALSANPALLVDVVPSRGSTRDRGDRADVLVCDGCDGAPDGSEDVLVVRPIDENRAHAGALTVEQPSHPIVSLVSSADGIGARVAPIDLPAAADVLMRAGPDPALMAYEQQGRRVVDVAFDVRRGELPLHVAFPVLIAGAIEWLAARGVNPVAVAPGAPLQWRLTSNAGRSQIVAPDGRALLTRQDGRVLTTVETDDPGVYTVRSDHEAIFVVNVASEESDVASAPATTAPGQADTAAAAGAVAHADLSAALLLAAAGLLAAEWRAWRRRTPRPVRAMRIARAIVVALVLASLAAPHVPAGDAPASVVFAVDRSASMPDAVTQGARDIQAMTAPMRGNDRAALVTFGAVAAIERRLRGGRLADVTADVPAEETNIEAALRAARAVLPRDGYRRIVLLSDGRETTGDAAREAAYAAAHGIGVDVVPLGARRAAGSTRAALARVLAPSEVRVGQPFGLDIRLEGTPGARARVSVLRDDAALASREATIDARGAATIAVADRVGIPGLFVYRAVAESVEDGERSDAGAVVAASGRPRVCLVSTGVHSADLLLSRSFDVARLAPEAVPASASSMGLAGCDSILLDDVPPDRLPAAAFEALAQYVERLGGGLILTGGPRSLYPAGYSATPLARALPVDLRRGAGRRAPELALVLVLDKSGSMADGAAGATKIELARRAVAAVLGAVPAGDALGVIAFDRTPSAIVALAAGHDPARVRERLRAIQPGGATAIAPALALAGEWLAASPARRKHVVLVSDGRSTPDDEAQVRAWAERRAAALSVVATGDDVDRRFLRGVAERTGGRAYFPDDLRTLPQIVAREAARASGGWRIDEPFTVRLSRHAIVAGLEAAGAPEMGGYVGATARPTADIVLKSHLDDPILAGWRFGLGRVVVFTSALSSAWSAPLRRWSGFGALWAQTTRWVSRPFGARAMRVAMTAGDGRARVAVDVTRPDGRFSNALDVSAVIRAPGRDDDELVTLAQTAPGHYEASVAAARAGAYLAAVTARDPISGLEARAVAGAYEAGAAERRSIGIDLPRLQAIARAGGGSILQEGDSPFAGPRPSVARPVREWLAGLALLVFVVDVAGRRGLRPARLAAAWRALALRGRQRAAA